MYFCDQLFAIVEKEQNDLIRLPRFVENYNDLVSNDYNNNPM